MAAATAGVIFELIRDERTDRAVTGPVTAKASLANRRRIVERRLIDGDLEDVSYPTEPAVRAARLPQVDSTDWVSRINVVRSPLEGPAAQGLELGSAGAGTGDVSCCPLQRAASTHRLEPSDSEHGCQQPGQRHRLTVKILGYSSVLPKTHLNSGFHLASGACQTLTVIRL